MVDDKERGLWNGTRRRGDLPQIEHPLSNMIWSVETAMYVVEDANCGVEMVQVRNLCFIVVCFMS